MCMVDYYYFIFFPSNQTLNGYKEVLKLQSCSVHNGLMQSGNTFMFGCIWAAMAGVAPLHISLSQPKAGIKQLKPYTLHDN